MSAVDALDIYYLLETADAPIWIDGGWAVDANLGQQMREHGDLDIVAEERHLSSAISALRSHGYDDVQRDDTRPWNFVMGDDSGHEVDFHVIVVDSRGDGVYGPPKNGDRWPAESLRNTGTILGRVVRATSPRWLVASHTGYLLKDKDRRDVSALCERFGLQLPPEYERFRSS